MGGWVNMYAHMHLHGKKNKKKKEKRYTHAYIRIYWVYGLCVCDDAVYT